MIECSDLDFIAGNSLVLFKILKLWMRVERIKSQAWLSRDLSYIKSSRKNSEYRVEGQEISL